MQFLIQPGMNEEGNHWWQISPWPLCPSPGFVTAKGMRRAPSSHPVAARAPYALSTSPASISGSRAQTRAAVSSANMTSSWRPSSSPSGRYSICGSCFGGENLYSWLVLKIPFVSPARFCYYTNIYEEYMPCVGVNVYNAAKCLQIMLPSLF